MNTPAKNPYIGPRTFQKNEGHLFYGRDREARDLAALVVSERLVVFYAQSGAGKSSIVNTRLIPALEAKEYEVLPVARVSGDMAAGLDVDNIYVYNLIRSLEQHETDPAVLSKISILDFLAHLKTDENGFYYDPSPVEHIAAGDDVEIVRRALVIDQFEELFSTFPEAWKKRDDFFLQLTQAMQDDPGLWVVLVMREDFIAALSPYAHHIYNGLRIRYYMQRLEREATLQAVTSPVKELRPYAEGVAEKLIDDLCSIKVQRPDGKFDTQLGQYIEPVQMQVVCYGLWENLSPEGKQITEKDLQEVGDINQSLQRYYDGRVSAIAKEKNVKERSIREWFDKELITIGGTRNMVLRNLNAKDSLDDHVIQALQGGLVRGEMRAGQIWYELSHDRLIEPVRTSNAKWFEKNLSLFQRQADLWAQQGRSNGLLLSGVELEKAEDEIKTMDLTDDEQVFISECRLLQKREWRDRNQRRIIFAALIVSILLLVVAGYSWKQAQNSAATANNAKVIADQARANAVQAQTNAEQDRAKAVQAEADAVQAKEDAVKQANNALAGSLAAQADSIKNDNHALALLLGAEAYSRDPQSLLTRTTLFQLLQYTPYTRTFGFVGSVSTVAISPDGKWIAVASCLPDENNSHCTAQGNITLFNDQLENRKREIPGDYGIIYSLAFHQYPDKLTLVAGGCVSSGKGCEESQGLITLWDITPEKFPQRWQLRDHTALVKTIAFNPTGTLLATGSYDTTIVLWDLTNLDRPRQVGAQPDLGSFVNNVAFSPDGNTLTAAGDDKTIYLWDVNSVKNLSKLPLLAYLGHQGPVESVIFAPTNAKLNSFCDGGSVLATAGDDNRVYLWDWCPGTNSLNNRFSFALEGHTGYVKSISFNADGTMLASTGFDNKIILWDTSTGQQIGLPLSVHTKGINGVAFGLNSDTGADQPFLFSVSDDRTVIKWDLSTFNFLSRSSNQSSSFPDFKNWSLIENGVPVPIFDNLTLKFIRNDQLVTITDAQDQEYLKLTGFDNLIGEMYFDGAHLITMDENGFLTQWTINPQDWLQKACEAVKRNLTKPLWDQFLKILQQTPQEKCVTAP